MSNELRKAEKNSVDAELVQVTAVAVCWLESRGYDRADILGAIVSERNAQDEKWSAQRDQPSGMWLAILLEEVGEVGTALLDSEWAGR